MKEFCFFSLDQWEISIHLLWAKSFNIPHHCVCDPHLNQTKLNGLLPMTIPGLLSKCKLANIHEVIISINSGCRNKRNKTLYKQQNLWGQHFFFVHIAHIPALGGGQLTLKFIFRLTVHFGFLFVECMMMESHKFCFVWELTLSWA